MNQIINKISECKNTKKDKLALIEAVLSSGVKLESSLRFPSVIYFSISGEAAKMEKFAESGFSLVNPISVQVNKV
jgi:hypothetical protein